MTQIIADIFEEFYNTKNLALNHVRDGIMTHDDYLTVMKVFCGERDRKLLDVKINQRAHRKLKELDE